MKDSTTMTFEQLGELRDSVNAVVAKRRSEIAALAERSRKSRAALTKALTDATPAPVPAEERERLEGKLRDLGAARTVEIGAAHADGRKPVTTKLDKAISQAETDLAAYQAKVEAAKEAEPAFEEMRSAARSRHDAEVREINEKVGTIKRAIAAQERLLAEAAMRYACHVARAAVTDETVANRLQRLGDGQSMTAGRMEEMFKGSAFSDLGRHFESGTPARLRRDAELDRLAALGLDLTPAFEAFNAPLARHYASAPVGRRPSEVTVTENEPTDPRDRRYMQTSVVDMAGRQRG